MSDDQTTKDVTEEVIEEVTEVEGETTETNPEDGNVDPEINYKEKFSASTAEAQRLASDLKERDARIAELEAEDEPDNIPTDTEEMYPGFNDLPAEEQKNLIEYTNSIKNKAVEEVRKDPAIAFAQSQYAERKFDTALEKAIQEHPELAEDRDTFKDKYFKADNVPDNIDEILGDLSKVHLYDKAKDIGAQEEAGKADRIEIERQKGGDKTPVASRSLADWQRLQQNNPAEFAKQSKQYNQDLASGKLE